MANEHAPSRDSAIDLLRAFAILFVLGFHSADLPGRPDALAHVLAYGWMGVDLFFVLSGYLIARQVFAVPPGSRLGAELESFWTKRWLRTLPLYFAVLAAFVVLKPLVFKYPFAGDPWRYLIFTQNFTILRDFVPSWSLCVEEQFYLVFPVVAFLVAQRRRPPAWVWLGCVVCSIVLRALVWRSHGAMDPATFAARVSWPTPTHLDGIATGVFVAATERAWSGLPRRALLAAVGAALFVATCAMVGPTPGASWIGTVGTYPLISASFAMMLVGLRGLALPSRLAAVTRWIAIWSYGAYLWHALVSRTVDHFAARLGSWPVEAACFLVATFSVAALTYALIEKPMLSLRDTVVDEGARAFVRRRLGLGAP